MKAALILDKDPESTGKTAQLLKMLGYLPAPARSADEALAIATSICFDVIITCTSINHNDRRALTGELKRLAPGAAVVLIAEDYDEYAQARGQSYVGVSAVLTRQMMAAGLWRVIEFGIDGYGLQPPGVPASFERRRTTH